MPWYPESPMTLSDRDLVAAAGLPDAVDNIAGGPLIRLALRRVWEHGHAVGELEALRNVRTNVRGGKTMLASFVVIAVSLVVIAVSIVLQ